MLVHVTSLDRIWPKLNLPTGAYGEKCIFGCLEVYKPFFYVKGPFFFSDKVWNLIIDYLGTKKWVSHFKKWLFDVKNAKNIFFGSNTHFLKRNTYFVIQK